MVFRFCGDFEIVKRNKPAATGKLISLANSSSKCNVSLEEYMNIPSNFTVSTSTASTSNKNKNRNNKNRRRRPLSNKQLERFHSWQGRQHYHQRKPYEHQRQPYKHQHQQQYNNNQYNNNNSSYQQQQHLKLQPEFSPLVFQCLLRQQREIEALKSQIQQRTEPLTLPAPPLGSPVNINIAGGNEFIFKLS